MKVLYTATMTATGGRAGKVLSTDGKLEFDLSMPKELGGEGGEGVNPEILFAAGYSACFHSAMKFIAKRKKIEIEGSSVTAEVGIGGVRGPNGPGFGLEVHLKISLPEMEKEAAEELVKTAHETCPYSNATRNNIQVTLSIV